MMEKQAEKEFKRFARRNLISPRKCRRIEQTQYYINELHNVIKDFKKRFNYVPESAQLMFNEYQNIQDRMVYANFKQLYQFELC